VYEKLGRPEDAGAAFEQYVDLLTNGVNGNSDDWKSMQRRTVAYHRFAGRAWNAYLSGRWQHAIDYYTWAFELAPGRTDRMRANQLLVRGIAHTKLEHWDEAMDDFRATCQLDPQPRRYSWLAIALIGKRDFARARDALEDALDIKEPSPDNLKIGRHSLYNRTAWLLATCADEQVRDPKQAVEYAERAVELVPGHAPVREGAYRNTLGVACYRAGDFQRAIDELEQSCELFVHRNNAFNTFFLAMAHWQLGNPEKAREYYAEAVAWMDEHAKDNEELLRFRAEAQALPGLEGERSEIGEQVTRD
jgi:tetratricopeptide (TPR) repeat protein